MESMPTQWQAQLAKAGQGHVVAAWAALDAAQRSRLLTSLAALDWSVLAEARSLALQPTVHAPDGAEPGEILDAPSADYPWPLHAQAEAARPVGEALFAEGRVACVLVAGGQGTRLGFDKPKGLLPIWPLSKRTLFDGFAGQLRAAEARFGKQPPLFVMTSDETHAATEAAWREANWYGLRPELVSFFKQGNTPVLSRHGELRFAEPGVIAMAPDGHGGCVAALARSGSLTRMRELGCDWVSYFQVDNPAVTACDAAFIGLCASMNSDACLKVVRKSSPAEKVGVFGRRAGRACIVEYSELSAEQAEARTTDGALAWRGGSIAVHAFRRAFLESVATQVEQALPLHRALKAIPHVEVHDGAWQTVRRAEPDAWKFERFVFDVLPLAQRVVAVEVQRTAEFLPVKDATGVHSPGEVAKALMSAMRAALAANGVHLRAHQSVEISPELWGCRERLAAVVAMSRNDLVAAAESGQPIVLEAS